MVREDPKKIAEQVQKQDDDYYGEEAASGHAAGLETDDDADEALEDFIGNKPEPEEDLNIAKEVDEDEHSLTPPDDSVEEQDQEEI